MLPLCDHGVGHLLRARYHPPAGRDFHLVDGGLGGKGDVGVFREEDAARQHDVRHDCPGVGVTGLRVRRFAGAVAVRGEPGRERAAGTLHVVAEHDRCDHRRVPGVLVVVERLLGDADEARGFRQVPVARVHDVHDVAWAVLGLRAACGLVPRDAGDDARFDARELLGAREHVGELREASCSEAHCFRLGDLGAMRLDREGEGDLGARGEGVLLADLRLHDHVEQEDLDDDEAGERHVAAQNVAEIHLLLHAPKKGRCNLLLLLSNIPYATIGWRGKLVMSLGL